MPGAGHWLMEEAPGFVIPKLVDFLRSPESLKHGHESDSTLIAGAARLLCSLAHEDHHEEVS